MRIFLSSKRLLGNYSRLSLRIKQQINLRFSKVSFYYAGKLYIYIVHIFVCIQAENLGMKNLIS